MNGEIQSFFKKHPKLVPVDDFEVGIQRTSTEKKKFVNGVLTGTGQEERLWVQLKIKHRNRPGIAAATTFYPDTLEEMVLAALENAEKSHPNPWFRFPVWSEVGSKPDAPPLVDLGKAYESGWHQLHVKTQTFQEVYEVKKSETEIFRRSEKNQRASQHLSLFQSWELGAVTDCWWGYSDRNKRLKKIEGLAHLIESQPEERVQLGEYFSLASPAAATLVTRLGDWFSSQKIHRQQSPLFFEKIGEPLFSPKLNLVDDGSEVLSSQSLPFDLEGVRTQRTQLVEQGYFRAPLFDAYFSAMNNCKSTGNAFLPSEVSFEPEVVPRGLCVVPGPQDENQVWGKLGSGIRIEFFSRAQYLGQQELVADAWGWEVQKGRVTKPVVLRNQRLNVLKLMNQLIETSNEAEVCGKVKTPTLFFRNRE